MAGPSEQSILPKGGSVAQVGIVTDSTSSMPPDVIEEHGIFVVPQVLNWGDESLLDGVEITTEEFYRRLQRSNEMPTTSQATIAGFKEAYEDLHGQGRPIVTVCLSDKLSGTLLSAHQAREMLPEARIEIINSYTVAMALGFQVLAAARAAEAGAGLEDVVAEVERTRELVGVVLMVDTLEFLHRGGRIGGAARLAGAALNVKPILEVADGEVQPLERVRTRTKAINRLLDILEERIEGRGPVQLAIHHTGEWEFAQEMGREIEGRFSPSELYNSVITPVVGTHAGPGAFALVYCTSE